VTPGTFARSAKKILADWFQGRPGLSCDFYSPAKRRREANGLAPVFWIIEFLCHRAPSALIFRGGQPVRGHSCGPIMKNTAGVRTVRGVRRFLLFFQGSIVSELFPARPFCGFSPLVLEGSKFLPHFNPTARGKSDIHFVVLLAMLFPRTTSKQPWPAPSEKKTTFFARPEPAELPLPTIYNNRFVANRADPSIAVRRISKTPMFSNWGFASSAFRVGVKSAPRSNSSEQLLSKRVRDNLQVEEKGGAVIVVGIHCSIAVRGPLRGLSKISRRIDYALKLKASQVQNSPHLRPVGNPKKVFD